jgi:homoserine kinase
LQFKQALHGRPMDSVTAFAPASVGNVGVGFDILGHALEGVGDTVSLRRRKAPGVVLVEVSGLLTELPREPASNSATRPLLRLMAEHGIRDGLEVRLHKGIPLGSGMGGSAASAVAAVVAADALWGLELDHSVQLEYALDGESAASGEAHPDNAAASLLGGLVLTEPGTPRAAPGCRYPPAWPACFAIPRWKCAHATRGASWQAPSRGSSGCASPAGSPASSQGCLRDDLAQVSRCLRDEIIWPQRARLVPGAEQALAAAHGAGSLGGSLSGSGPSVFAWTPQERAEAVAAAMRASFSRDGVSSDTWISSPDAPGARILAES